MNRRHIFSLSVIPALALMLPGVATAQQKTLKEQLAGTWTAVSWEQVGKDGSKFERFGANPKGVNVFDANGRFVVIYARSARSDEVDGDGKQSDYGRIDCLLRHIHGR